MGTPRTLKQAIENGCKDFDYFNHLSERDSIEEHVSDFIRQKLAVIMLSSDPVEQIAAAKMRTLLGV